jgi:hypothetical protein
MMTSAVSSGFENLKTSGSSLPKSVQTNERFVVRTWLWNRLDQDYTLENPDVSGQACFREYANANDCFEQADFPEMKVELVQYKYGLCHVVKSRINLPQMQH